MLGMDRGVSKLLLEYLQYFPCVVIVGPRQCGKTTLVRGLPEHWSHFDLERAADHNLVSSDPDGFLRLHNEFIAVDEAQVLPALFPALRVAIDERRDIPGRFVLTGSSSPDLQHSLAESLAGRVGVIEMSPLTFAETQQTQNQGLLALLQGHDPPTQRSVNPERERALQEYWFQGGYPEPWLRNSPRFRSLWRDNFLKTYLERDLRRLFPGLDPNRFRNFLAMLASMSGAIVNMSDLGRSLSVSQPTIRDYLDIAHGTYLWRRLYPFEKNVTKRIVKHPYGYLRDCGLVHFLLHIPNPIAMRTHPVAGRSWQSMVIEEILRTLETEGLAHRAFYYRTAAGAEVDLVLEGDFGLVPFEIKLSSTVTRHELRPLRDFVAEHKCRMGVVVNNGDRILQYDDKIVGLPFLLL